MSTISAFTGDETPGTAAPSLGAAGLVLVAAAKALLCGITGQFLERLRSTTQTIAVMVGLLAGTSQALAAVAGPATITAQLNAAVSVNFVPFITGAGITGVTIVSQPKFGTASASGTSVTYTPRNNFFGQDTFTYLVIDAGGASAPGTVTATVLGRPEPGRDASVVGLLGAQNETAQRFARTQISNFQRRLESLHRVAPAPNPEANGAQTTRNAAPSGNTDARTSAALEPPLRLALFDEGTPATSRSFNLAQLSVGTRRADSATSTGSGLGYWMDGNMSFGTRDATANRSALDFTTSGVSAGVDYRVTQKLVLGAGLGFAHDRTAIGTDGTRSRADGYSVAAYGSYQPTNHTFIDGVLGAGSLRFDSDRLVPAAADFAHANRTGRQFFGALIAGYEHRGNGMLWSPYGRVDFAADRLKLATESGAGLNALTYFTQNQRSYQGALGLRAESAHEAGFGWVVPRVRTEYRYDSQGDGLASVAYADQLATGPRYAVGTGNLDHGTLVIGLGSDFILRNGLSLGVDYQLNYASSQSKSQTLRLLLQMTFDGKSLKPDLYGLAEAAFTKPLELNVDAGYVYDDNVNRASNRADVLWDQAFSANVSRNWFFPITDHMRMMTTANIGGEKFRHYEGLSRVSGGVGGELQYRTSAELTASTLALFGKALLERFDSSQRDGHRYSVGASIVKPLSESLTVFGALTHEIRHAKSAVFEGKHNSARLNIDYALHKDGAVYVGGEYRRGDIVSTGRPTLANLDIAKVLTQDDVFGAGFTNYRIDAKTWIGSVGYNLGFGPRDSLDISWRRAHSAPTQSTSFVAPAFRYVANQISVVYLTRF